MNRTAALARAIVVAAAIGAWLAALGIAIPMLDALASFLPLFAAVAVAGALLAWRRWRRVVPLAALAIAPAAVVGTIEASRPIPTAGPAVRPLRVLTHNMWIDNRTPAATGAAIARAGADIVLLQETTRDREAVLAAAGRRFPYHTNCPGGGCDLAILSRWPIRAAGYFLKDARGDAFGPPLLWATIAVPDMPPVTVATLHYPWPFPAHRQASRRVLLARALARIDRDRLIVAGDMNLTPWSAAMRQQDGALAPLTRMTRAAWSWPAAFPFLPIDHLYAGPAWGLVRVDRLPAAGSDHRPLLVTLAPR